MQKGIPYVKFGNGNGKTIVLVSGIHDGELPPQAVAFKLIDLLANYGGDINGAIYVFPAVFPEATANNTCIFNETNLNAIANVNGTISNSLVKFAKSVNASGLGDFHCTRHSDSDVGITCAMCTLETTYEIYLIAGYIVNETGYALKKYDVAGVPYAGAVEDCSNILGLPAITSEALSNHRAIEYGATEVSFNMMASFLRYFGFDINRMMKIPLTCNNLTLTFTSPYNYNSSSKNVSLISNDSNHFGYWVWSSDMYDMNLTQLANKGVTDILLNYYAFERYNKTAVEKWVADANEKGIHIHIWALIFYDGQWNRPVSREGVVTKNISIRKLRNLKDMRTLPQFMAFTMII